MNLLTNELQAGVAHQSAGQQSRLTENLEAVANPKHPSTALRKLHKPAHDRRKACHGTAAQVVAIGKPAGQNDAIEIAGKLVFMPKKRNFLPELGLETIENVVIVARTGKSDNAPTHNQF